MGRSGIVFILITITLKFQISNCVMMNSINAMAVFEYGVIKSDLYRRRTRTQTHL